MGADGRRGEVLTTSEPQNKAYVWLNGALLPEQEARISLFDRGYLYGDGLFETMRAYGGGIFRLAQHIERLQEGARTIRLELPLNAAEAARAAGKLLQANTLSDAYLRLSVSRGIGLGPLPPEGISPTISLIARPLRLPDTQEYADGWSAILVESSISPGAGLSQLKPLSYLDKLLAKMKAREAGVQEAVLVNSRGEVTEASTSNLFVLHGKRLLTPPPEAGLLKGITRGVVMELAPNLSLQVAESRLLPSDIFSAQECFLTNSIMEIMPLCWLEGERIGEGRRGPVTSALRKAYADLVKKELKTANQE
jgi:branched-chain amino acid aminotransferase